MICFTYLSFLIVEKNVNEPYVYVLNFPILISDNMRESYTCHTYLLAFGKISSFPINW